MDTRRFSPRETFLSEFPVDLLRRLSLGIVQSYSEAADYCSENYDKPEDHDLRGFVRRANIERMVRQTIQSFGGAAQVVAVPNEIKSAYHRKVVSGQVALTVSAVADPKRLTRDALFRAQYARDPQASLFDEPEESLGADGSEALYAILLHGPQKANLAAPEFLQIGFPDSLCQKYLDRIDLFALFPNMVVVEDVDTGAGVVPRLRPGVAKPGKSGG